MILSDGWSHLTRGLRCHSSPPFRRRAMSIVRRRRTLHALSSPDPAPDASRSTHRPPCRELCGRSVWIGCARRRCGIESPSPRLDFHRVGKTGRHDDPRESASVRFMILRLHDVHDPHSRARSPPQASLTTCCITSTARLSRSSASLAPRLQAALAETLLELSETVAARLSRYREADRHPCNVRRRSARGRLIADVPRGSRSPIHFTPS